jgi:hypothetical protein
VSAGRTLWRAKDCGWSARDRVVELGEEFGPAGPMVLDWIEERAKLENDGGRLKSGFRAIQRGAFLRGGIEEAERIVRHAAEIGALDDLAVDEHGRTFTCRVSGWQADQTMGRAAFRQREKRTRETSHEDDVTGRDESRPVTHRHVSLKTGEKRTEEETDSLRSSDSSARASTRPDEPPDDFPDDLRPMLDAVLPILTRIAAERGAAAVTVRAVARTLANYPRRPHFRAAQDLEHWLVDGTGRTVKVKDVVGFYRNQLRDRWQDQATAANGTSHSADKFAKYDDAMGL